MSYFGLPSVFGFSLTERVNAAAILTTDPDETVTIPSQIQLGLPENKTPIRRKHRATHPTIPKAISATTKRIYDMLVLSRKKDESIVLDGQIEIQVLKIKGNTIRLGIKAPAHIKVLRGELSPFDVESEVEKDKRPEPTNNRLGLEMTNREVTIANPFAIANAG